jgi:NifU-like protein involved in Fe-S cluster formation
MADSDLIKLYSGRILELAADIPHAGRLDAPDASVRKRSPQCGSTVSVDLCVTDGRVTAFAQDVRACALGQASAAILGAHVVGQDRATLAALRDAVKSMLTADGPVPAAPFDGYEVLLPAREFRNRHASILLSLEATVEAMDEAARSACA